MSFLLLGGLALIRNLFKVMEAHREEVTLLSKIFHPNVCLFMGACFEPGNMMIVTELLALGDFKALLYSKELDLSLFTRMRMMTDAARGLTWLHQGDFVVIHRDLVRVLFHCIQCVLLADHWPAETGESPR